MAESTCTNLTNPSSIFATSLNTLGFPDIIKTLDSISSSIPQSLSSCIGSIDAGSLLATAMATLTEPTCAAAFSMVSTFNADITTSMKNSTQTALNDTVFRSICTPLANAVQCIDLVLLPQLMSIISAQPCCESSLSEGQAAMGEPINLALPHMIHLISDVLCSTQSPGFHNQTSQTCAYSILESFRSQSSHVAFIATALRALQIPNDQGEAAMTGNMFVDTRNKTSLAVMTAPLLPGSCVKPLDSFLGWVRRLPILQAPIFEIDLRPLFEDNQCIPGGLVLPTLPDSYQTTMSALVNNSTACFHIANGYTVSSTLFNTPHLDLFSNSFASNSSPTTNTSVTPSPNSTTNCAHDVAASAAWIITLNLFVLSVS